MSSVASAEANVTDVTLVPFSVMYVPPKATVC